MIWGENIEIIFSSSEQMALVVVNILQVFKAFIRTLKQNCHC